MITESAVQLQKVCPEGREKTSHPIHLLTDIAIAKASGFLSLISGGQISWAKGMRHNGQCWLRWKDNAYPCSKKKVEEIGINKTTSVSETTLGLPLGISVGLYSWNRIIFLDGFCFFVECYPTPHQRYKHFVIILKLFCKSYCRIGILPLIRWNIDQYLYKFYNCIKEWLEKDKLEILTTTGLRYSWFGR